MGMNKLLGSLGEVCEMKINNNISVKVEHVPQNKDRFDAHGWISYLYQSNENFPRVR